MKGKTHKDMEQKKDRRAVGVKVLPEGIEEYCERHTTVLTELHETLGRLLARSVGFRPQGKRGKA